MGGYTKARISSFVFCFKTPHKSEMEIGTNYRTLIVIIGNFGFNTKKGCSLAIAGRSIRFNNPFVRCMREAWMLALLTDLLTDLDFLIETKTIQFFKLLKLYEFFLRYS